MAIVFVPKQLEATAGGASEIAVEGDTVRRVLEALAEEHPKFVEAVLEDDELRPDLAVAIDGEISTVGLRARVESDSEVHFIPALAGG